MNLRTGPGEAYAVVKTLSPNEGLTVQGRTAASDWWKVSTPEGTGGWVSASLVAVKLPVVSIPVVAAPPPPPTATPVPPKPTPTVAASAPVQAGSVSAVGDSVMLDAAPYLQQDIAGIAINAAVSRQVSAGIGILTSQRAAGQLGSAVIIGLGTNGTFTTGQLDQIMQILSGQRRVVFVNVRVDRSWEAGDNAVLAAGAQRYPTARVADWYDASANQPAYFAKDGFHLTPAGATVYAHLVAAAVSGP